MDLDEDKKVALGRTPLNKGVVALGWVSFLNDAASEMIYPLLPDFVTRVLGAGPAVLGLIEGVAEATASLAKVAAGWWSDRVRRRKPFVVLGYSVATVTRPLIGLATSWAQVLAIRFADRLGKGLRTPPRDALLADMTPSKDRGRAFGLQRAMDNAGGLVGPILAAIILRFWIREERDLFFLALFPGLIAVLLLVLRVPEKRREADPPRAPQEKPPGLSRPLRIVIAIFGLFTLANSTDAFLLLRARDCGIPLWQLPLLWAFFNGAKAAVGVPGGALSDRIGRIPTISLGWLIYALSYLGFAFAASPLAACSARSTAPWASPPCRPRSCLASGGSSSDPGWLSSPAPLSRSPRRRPCSSFAEPWRRPRRNDRAGHDSRDIRWRLLWVRSGD